MAKKTAKKKATRKRAPAATTEAAPQRAAPELPPLIPLSELLGQSGASDILTSALRSGRLHHAWIFHGPVGVGKMTAARAFASMLLDPTTAPGLSGELAPDPDSRVQHLIRAGSHPDLHHVTKELAEVSREASVRTRKLTTIPKDVVLEFLVEPAVRTRSHHVDSLAAKVFIVDEAHLLGRESQNLLLKTLEEPPPGTVIILVTPSEERLLPTIRSRCQRVAFTPLDDDAMSDWIKRTGLGPPSPHLLAMAEGSPGRLAALTASGAAGWLPTLEPMLEHVDSGHFIVDLGPAMADLIGAHAEAAVAKRKNASKDAANRAAAHELFTQLAWRYRAQLRDHATEPSTLRRAAQAIDHIHAAETRLASNVAVALVTDALAADLADA